MAPALTLRPVEDADLPVLFEHQADRASFEMAVVAPRGPEDFAQHWAKVRADETNLVRVIVERGAVVGYVCSFVVDGERQVGYWVGRAHWGRGIATQALRAFLVVEARRPLYAHAAVGNAGSLRVLEKCGFARVGTAKDVSVRGGPTVDEAVFVLSA